jgi:hypothetical protein
MKDFKESVACSFKGRKLLVFCSSWLWTLSQPNYVCPYVRRHGGILCKTDVYLALAVVLDPQLLMVQEVVSSGKNLWHLQSVKGFHDRYRTSKNWNIN